MKNLVAVFLMWPAYLHESIHWIAARLMGLQAEITVLPEKRKAFTEVAVEYKWQQIIVALAPALWTPVFAVVFATVTGVNLSQDPPAVLLLFWASVAIWLAACANDFSLVLRLTLKH